MSEFEYRGEVNRMLLAARVLAEVDLEAILIAISNADTLGPFVDPTAYRDALQRGDMHAIRDLAAALREPMRIFNERIAPKVPA